MDELFNFDANSLPPIEQWYFIAFGTALGIFMIFFIGLIFYDLLFTKSKKQVDDLEHINISNDTNKKKKSRIVK